MGVARFAWVVGALVLVLVGAPACKRRSAPSPDAAATASPTAQVIRRGAGGFPLPSGATAPVQFGSKRPAFDGSGLRSPGGPATSSGELAAQLVPLGGLPGIPPARPPSPPGTVLATVPTTRLAVPVGDPLAGAVAADASCLRALPTDGSPLGPAVKPAWAHVVSHGGGLTQPRPAPVDPRGLGGLTQPVPHSIAAGTAGMTTMTMAAVASATSMSQGARRSPPALGLLPKRRSD